MSEFQPSRPTRRKADLAEIVEMLLDKGIVINADIVVSIGDTQLLGIQVRAAIASFETAAKYGLEFPEGTDMRRVAAAAGDPELAEMDRPAVPIDPTRGVNITEEDEGDGDGEAEDENENASDGTGASEGESTDEDDAASEDEATSTDGGEIPRRTDQRTDHVGTRPDPMLPTQGGLNMISDVSSGGIAEEAGAERDEAADAGSAPAERGAADDGVESGGADDESESNGADTDAERREADTDAGDSSDDDAERSDDGEGEPE